MGQTERDGIVMIQEHGVWGPACGEGFGKKEADVTCRHLGYDNGDALCCRPYGDVAWQHRTRRKVTCHGNETRVHQCSQQTARHDEDSYWRDSLWWRSEEIYCNKHDYAAVVCRHHPAPPLNEMQLSLMGQSSFTGRLVLTYDGVEGGVCGEGWNQPAAERACQDLGFNHGANYSHVHTDTEDRALGPVWTASVTCDGASSFGNCKHAAFGTVTSCDHYAAVLCYNDFNHANKGYPYYRLDRDASSPANSGRVGVFLDGQWGTVSDDQRWTEADLDVLCKSMGFSTGRRLPSDAVVAPGSGTVWRLAPNCGGQETDLMHCRVTEAWSKAEHQDHSDDLKVACYNSVMLNHGVTHHDGIVFIQPSSYKQTDTSEADDSDWMPLCFHDFDNNDASYLLSLRYNDVYYAYGDYYYDGEYDDDDYYYDDDDENNVVKLHNQTWGSLTVLYNGLPGHICPDGWSDKAAQVACRELGFPHGQKYLHSNWYDDYIVKEMAIWSSNFHCLGTENRLSECRHDGWGHTQGCKEQDAYAGVFCYKDEGVKYRLYNPDPQATWGRVEILLPHTSTWGTLCRDSWEDSEAMVVCRMFGYKSGHMYTVKDLPPAHGVRYERYEDCQGHEEHVEQCIHEGFVPAYDSSCVNHRDDAGVFCIPHLHDKRQNKTSTTATPADKKPQDSSNSSASSSSASSRATSSASPDSSTTSSSPNVGGIVGGVLALVVVIGGVVAGLWLWRRYYPALPPYQQQHHTPEPSVAESAA
ncbi:scavenger receptor cysteine-rich domain-containing group B protein-like isoform X2 [Babylonia areolata]|uniref:scavenger receptor cysteine-rich domain-containing group B protein-like isoform X2 n=1 Tax=Babylonia areolata TaxID=304850 RepID=UPI003FD3E3DA